jgi:TatD family-associated radical SAM protein
MTDANFAYRYRKGLYLNITNRCPTACAFCIKSSWKMCFRGSDLCLNGREPSAAEVVAAAEKAYRERAYEEAVFCGFGEPTYRLGDMLAVCQALAERLPQVRRRLNTVGLGDLICGRRIAPELAGRLQAVRVSLNSAEPKRWAEIMNPLPEFRERGFEAAVQFIRDCSALIEDTSVTAVELPGTELEACRRLAGSLGARFIARPYLEAYEER